MSWSGPFIKWGMEGDYFTFQLHLATNIVRWIHPLPPEIGWALTVGGWEGGVSGGEEVEGMKSGKALSESFLIIPELIEGLIYSGVNPRAGWKKLGEELEDWRLEGMARDKPSQVNLSLQSDTCPDVQDPEHTPPHPLPTSLSVAIRIYFSCSLLSFQELYTYMQ